MSIDKKTLTLTFGEQSALLGILRGFKGDMEDLAFILDDVKLLKITDADFEAVKAVESRDPGTRQPTGMFVWDEDFALQTIGERTFEVSDIAVTFAKKNIDERSKKAELTIRDGSTIALRKKLA